MNESMLIHYYELNSILYSDNEFFPNVPFLCWNLIQDFIFHLETLGFMMDWIQGVKERW